MSVWFAELWNVLLIGMELCIYFIIANTFFVSKQENRIRVVYILILFLFNYAITQTVSSFLLRSTLLLILFTGFTKMLYRSNALLCVFISITYLAILGVSDAAILYLFLMISKVTIADLISAPVIYTIFAFAAKIFELLIVSVIRSVGHQFFQGKTHGIWHYFVFSLYPFVTFIGSIILYQVAVLTPHVAKYLLACVILLFFSDLFSIILMAKFEQQQADLNRSYILSKQLDTAMDGISVAMQSYNNERKLTHDFQNQMLVIRGMLDHAVPNKEIMEYIGQVSNYTSSSSLAVTTHRVAVDVLLNQKYALAKQKQIAFQVRLDDLSMFPLPDNELVVLLSNLIDNALEASEKILDESRRSITIKMSVNQSECLLSVENSVAYPVKIVNNHILTTKKHTEQHGYGLQNVASIVHTHDGYYTLSCDNETFCFADVFAGTQSQV